MRGPRRTSRTALFTAWLLPGTLVVLAAQQNVETKWEKTAEWPAPEAKQAAAADVRFLYAISNSQVARYDRDTGQRVAVSTGKAEHLKSGFLWEGRVYCAHSNYPRLPEESKILVLNPEAMRLSTFKDFGNAGRA